MPQHHEFKRTIGLSTAVSLVIATIIGSGIFMRPAEMAALLGSPTLIFCGLDHSRRLYYGISNGVG